LHWFMLIICISHFRGGVWCHVLFHLEAPQIRRSQARYLPRVGDG
jgi:hypothetical protein